MALVSSQICNITYSNKSPLLLTVPCDGLPRAYHAVHRCWRSVWQTGKWWWSLVYHTDHPPKLTALETIDMTTHTVDAHQSLNSSRDLTTPLSSIVCHPLANTCYHQPIYRIWSLYLNSLQRYKRWYKMSKMGWFVVARVTRGHWK